MKLMKFKRVAVTVLIVLAAYLLQCTLFNHLELAGIKPNLILIVTASFGFMRGQKEGMLVGFFAGLITDIQFGTILGFYALPVSYTHLMAVAFRRMKCNVLFCGILQARLRQWKICLILHLWDSVERRFQVLQLLPGRN